MSVSYILPRFLPGGRPVDYHEIGDGSAEVEVVVWRNELRDDGFAVRCRDWRAAYFTVCGMSDGLKERGQ